MKTLIVLSLLLFLANCSVHSVKIGKKCTTAGADGSFEKSFIWFVDKDTARIFDNKINKSNCKKNT